MEASRGGFDWHLTFTIQTVTRETHIEGFGNIVTCILGSDESFRKLCATCHEYCIEHGPFWTQPIPAFRSLAAAQ